MTKRNNAGISQKIKDLNHFLNVEKYYIKNAFKAVDMYYEKREFDEAEKLCNKICKVSKRTSSDYVNAQKFKRWALKKSFILVKQNIEYLRGVYYHMHRFLI